MQENDITHVMTAVASPWANGQVERVNRFLKSTLSKLINETDSWDQILGKTQFVLNNTWHKAINTTPSKMLLGYNQRGGTDKELSKFIESLTDTDKSIQEEREELRDAAKLVNQKIKEYNKVQYDKRHKKPSKYKEGDLVMIKITQHKPGINKKLTPKFKDPYQIKKLLNKNRFVVTEIPGFNLTQKPLNTILSSDKIKPWIRVNEVKPPDDDTVNGD